VLILRDGRYGIRFTGKPASLHVRDVLNDGLSFLRLRSAIGLCWLLRQLTRMHDHKPECLPGDPSVAVLDLDWARHTLSMPVARCFVLGPPGLLQQEGQSGLLLSPHFEFLPHRTGARHERHQADPVLQT
jgi:hypothetical protein